MSTSTKLSFDPNDYRSLKPLLALEVARRMNRRNANVVAIEFNDGHRPTGVARGRPALLEVDADVHLFSENAICSFLLPERIEERCTEVTAWLEWESSVLQPNLAPVVGQIWGGLNASDQSMDKARSPLDLLDSRLTGKNFLVGNEISAADISIFVSVYPMANDEKQKNYFSECSHAIDWFRRLNQLDSFKKVLSKATQEKGSQHFKSSFLSNSASLLTVMASSGAESEVVRRNVLERGVSESTIPSEHVELTMEEIVAARELWLAGKCSLSKYKKQSHPILPIEGERNVLILSALPYVNNVPHLGNIIGCVLSADVFARYCRLRNYNTLYVCGTDEYGTATETKAIEEGVSPREICDKYFALHSEIYKWFGISFDHFGRTTTREQTEIAQELFWQIHRNGFMLEDSMEQLHCSHCDRFLADRFVEGTCPYCAYVDARGDQCDKCGKLINAVELISPRCKLCHTSPVKKTSKHLFLNLPKLADKVQEHFERVLHSGIWSPSAKMITRAWLREGLKPRCITRDLKWGVPVPLEGFKDKVFYVWYDAPIGYPSITATYTDAWKSWWKNPSGVQLCHFMAKDNVPFHSVMFPACLIGADDGYTLVHSLSATEYLNYEDGKFSKSRGVGVFGNDARDTGIPADIWRFYLLYIRPETQDSVFSWSDLMTKNNSELLNNLGNFINRALVFVSNFFDGQMPSMELMTDDDWSVIAHINREVQAYTNLLENMRLRDAIRHILNISRLGNQHIQNQKPWVLVKGSEQDKARAGTVIGLSVNVSCLLSIMLDPYMPTTAQTVRNQLGVNDDGVATDAFRVLPEGLIRYLEPGHRIGTPAPLFRKIESEEVEAFRRRFAGTQSSREITPSPLAKVTPVVNGQTADDEEDVDLNAAIANQGDVVRALKQKGADKADVAREVSKLLELKKRLSLATGEEPTQSAKQGKKKSPKKAI